MSNKKTKLLADAVAEADVLRNTALANAKLALQETFQPRLKSMLSKQLQREMEGDELEDEELPDEEVTDVTEEEGEEHEAGEAPEFEAGEQEEGDDDEVTEDEIPGEEGEIPAEDDDELEEDEDAECEYGDEDEDELDLEAIIKELEGEDEEGEEAPEFGEEEPEETADDEVTEDEDEIDLDNIEDDEAEAGDDEEDLDLEALMRELNGDELDPQDEAPADEEAWEDQTASAKTEVKRLTKELKEAYAVIEKQRRQIHEVNIFNSKLLFSTKLFRHFDLNESQKKKVIDAFDRTNTLREIKIVYSTLAETFKGVKVGRKLTESFQSDIKAGKRNQPIVDGDAFTNRMQELARIGKYSR
jgi:hypothetical protein